MATLTQKICDVCGGDAQDSRPRDMQVIMTTETTEGRSCKHHLSLIELDLCSSCKKKVVEDRMALMGKGAMGYNDYWFEPSVENSDKEKA